MSKFIHTSDIHVGECRTLDGYLARHESVLNQITNLAVERGVPLIIAGDIFHTRGTKHEERFLVDRWFGDIEAKNIPTIVITGNHDHLHDDVTQLDGYKNMPFKHIKFITWEPKVVSLNDIDFICIPWRSYDKEAFKKIIKDKLPLCRSKWKVVIAHECIVGSSFDNGIIAPKGLALPKLADIDYYAMGDIHGYQRTNVTNGYFPGSPLQFTFGDKPDKGLLFVDLEKQPVDPERILLKFKPLKIIKSVKEIDEDAYYMVRGEFEDVLEANKNENVVKSDWVKAEIDAIQYQKVGIVDGLAEFLASKSIVDEYQTRAVSWVKQLLNLNEVV
jgi:DNA repair exonuclease SbcCD nuclease subunit